MFVDSCLIDLVGVACAGDAAESMPIPLSSLKEDGKDHTAGSWREVRVCRHTLKTPVFTDLEL